MKKSSLLSRRPAEPRSAPESAFYVQPAHPWIMGVLNTTPDSFYGASRIRNSNEALARAHEMVGAGVDVLDIGGESTRPGAKEIPSSDELLRVLPMIQALRERWPHLPLSIDTQKAAVAREALDHGVQWINDISALRRDPAMAEVAAASRGPIVLMHMQGTPQTMQENPRYENVVDEVKRFFEERMSYASRRNIREERIILDPGFGFGKTVDHNVTLLRRLSELTSLGRPILVGLSRKSFIGRLLAHQPGHPQVLASEETRASDPLREIFPPEERLEGSLVAGLWAIAQGAAGLRVHDVGPTRRALTLWNALGAAS